MIDFHCHLDLFPEPLNLIEEVDAAGIYVLAVTTTPKAWPHLQTLLLGRKRIRCAVGLHPELVAERSAEVEDLCSIMAGTKYVGEVGLDGSSNLRRSFALQEIVFARIIQEAAKLGGKILSIHSRQAVSAVLDTLSRQANYGIAVLHWFSGSKKELDRAIELGCWFSVGPLMLQSKNGRDLASKMPVDRILTESDGPFAQLGSHPTKPTDIVLAEAALASIWKTAPPIARERILANLRHLLACKPS